MSLEKENIISRMRILYVEDDADTNEAMSAFLKRKAAVLHSTTNGEYGLQLFKDKKIDLVITDIKMPHMDGIEMVRNIKALDSEVKVIFISAYHEQDLFLQAISLRAEGFLTKPVSPGRDLMPLMEKLAKEIYRKQLLKEYTQTLKLILDYVDSMVIVTDGQMLYNANKAFLTFMGYDTIKAFSAHYPDIYTAFDKNWLQGSRQWRQFLESGHTFKVKIKNNIFLAKPNMITTDTGMKKYVVDFTDITHLENERNSILQEAAKDPLTGLENREAFEKYYDKQAAYAQKTGSCFYLVRITLANLDTINKSQGVQKADTTLVFIARTIKHFSSPDTIHSARWGGGVFLILLSQKGFNDKIHEKIRAGLQKGRFEPPLEIAVRTFEIDSKKPLSELMRKE